MSKGLDDYKIISVSTTMAEIKRQQKELKALEIIKELKCFTFYEIDNQYYVSGIGVSKEEYDLLKEVLL